jgi:hypothetical protein
LAAILTHSLPVPLPFPSSISTPSNDKLLLYGTLPLAENIVCNKPRKVTFFDEYGTTGNMNEPFNNSFLLFELVLSMAQLGSCKPNVQ